MKKEKKKKTRFRGRVIPNKIGPKFVNLPEYDEKCGMDQGMYECITYE